MSAAAVPTRGQLLIDGQLRQASDGRYFDVINPADESVVGAVPEATVADVENAVDAARRTFDETNWSSDIQLRKRIVTQLQSALRNELDTIKALQVAEAGSPRQILALIDDEIEYLHHYIGLADTFEWEVDYGIHETFGLRSHRVVRYEPYGVVAAIPPWNGPFLSSLRKVVPAIMSGNTVVLKPPPDTPLSGCLLAMLINERTDAPPGAINVITSSDPVVGGDNLTGSPKVDMFHFTGSSAIGERVAARAAVGVRKVVLELGGKSANVILEDADLDRAVPMSVRMSMMNSGQGCMLATRAIVHESIYDEFVERVSAAVSEVPWGDPGKEETIVGPIIRRDQLERIDGLVERARKSGARITTGGSKAHINGKGFYYLPTVVADAAEDSEVAQTEVFGPVLTIIKYRGGDDDAIRIANSTKYGLAAYVQTRSGDRAARIANRMRAGGVAIGESAFYGPDTPHGGYGASGIGREHGPEGFREFLQTKTVSVPVTDRGN
jgi:aldehyde dehydrogenase (NAD+)